MIAIPITAKNGPTGSATEIAEITESHIPISDIEFWMLAIRQSLFYFCNMMSIVSVGIVSHAKKSTFFLFITLVTLFAGFVSQHVCAQFLVGCLIPDCHHVVFA
jgi:hypothetical protein